MSEPALSSAKQTLLNALDSIEEIEGEMQAEVRHIAVVYSVVKRDEDGIHESGGWNHSDDPAWVIAALLRRGAESVEGSCYPADEDED